MLGTTMNIKKNQFNPSASSFITGVPVLEDTGWVIMAIDELVAKEIEHSAVLWLEGGMLYAVCLKMFRCLHLAWLPELQRVVLVGDNGQCCVVDRDGQYSEEFVTQSTRNPRNTGHLRAASQVGSDVIAVGMQRQVYRRTASGVWIDMMQGLPINTATVGGFEAVVAISENEIYAAGWHGEIWRFDGSCWHAVASPTTKIITSLCTGADGKVRGCGLGGLLIEGRHDGWQLVDHPHFNEDLFSIVRSDDEFFISSSNHLYHWSTEGITLVKSGVADSFGSLRTEGNLLWCFGQKNLLAYVDGNWKRLGMGS
jgi:hypothetical protein